MQQRTWEYGSTKNATVKGIVDNAIVLHDEDGEGHVLVGTGQTAIVTKNDNVTLEFCKGGPTGGYWKIAEIVGVQINGLNWFEDSGSWYEQWLHVKNARTLMVVRHKEKDAWMAQYVETVTDIHLLGWFVGDRNDALEFFGKRIPTQQ